MATSLPRSPDGCLQPRKLRAMQSVSEPERSSGDYAYGNEIAFDVVSPDCH
jgi:hypothetical protein